MLLLNPAQYLGANIISHENDGVFFCLTSYDAGSAVNDRLHAHVNAHLSLLLKGETTEKRGASLVRRKSGDLVFFPAAEPHRNSDTNPVSRNLNVEFTPQFLKEHEISERFFEKTGGIEALAGETVLKAFRESLRRDQFASESALGLLLTLFQEKRKPSTHRRATPQWVSVSREYLNDNWNKTVTLAELAATTGIHPVTLSSSFREYFGFNFGEYRRRIRIGRAMLLITATKMPLFEIAYECDFADQSHFIRSFYEITGFLPGEFRKLLK